MCSSEMMIRGLASRRSTRRYKRVRLSFSGRACGSHIDVACTVCNLLPTDTSHLISSLSAPPRAPPLHFSRDGRFKIMQIADLHYSVSAGSCRDTPLAPCSNSDNLTNTLLARMLDAEKPDFVVFSGDQLNGQGTSWDARSVLAKFAKAVTQRGIPWAAVFGNHDDEDGDASREQQIKYMQGLPYSMVEQGPKDIHGAGNYVLKVKSADAYVYVCCAEGDGLTCSPPRSMTHLLTMYYLDSGAYSKGFMNWFGFFIPTEYDWIHQVSFPGASGWLILTMTGL